MDVQYFKVAYELWKFHEYHMQKLSASKKKSYVVVVKRSATFSARA